MQSIRKTGPEIFDFDAKITNKALATFLPCGIPVYIIKSDSAEVSKVDYLFEAGYQYQPKKLISQHCVALLREGSDKFNASEISNLLDYHGVFVEAFSMKKLSGISLLLQAKFAQTVMPAVADFIFKPGYPEKELEIYNSNLFQKLKIENEKVKTLASKRLSILLFGENHPLGTNVQPEDVFQVTSNDLLNYHKKHIFVKNCKIIISGLVNDALLHTLNNSVKSYASPYNIEPEYKPKSINTSETKFELIERQGATQSAIRMGRIISFESIEEYHKLKVLNTLLGGYFGSRLMKNIREDKGYTYGIYSSISLIDAYHALFTIAAEVAADMSGKAIDEIRNELNGLSDREPGVEELTLVKKNMLGELLAMFDGPFASANVLKSLMEAEMEYEFVEQTIKAIHSFNQNDLKQLSSRYFNPEAMTTVVAGSLIKR